MSPLGWGVMDSEDGGRRGERRRRGESTLAEKWSVEGGRDVGK